MNRKIVIALVALTVIVIFAGISLGLVFKKNYLDLDKLEPRVVSISSNNETTIINMKLTYNGSRELIEYKTILNYEPENYEVINEYANNENTLKPGETVELKFIFPKKIVPNEDVSVYDLWFYFSGYFEEQSILNEAVIEGDLNAFILY